MCVILSCAQVVIIQQYKNNVSASQCIYACTRIFTCNLYACIQKQGKSGLILSSFLFILPLSSLPVLPPCFSPFTFHTMGAGKPYKITLVVFQSLLGYQLAEGTNKKPHRFAGKPVFLSLHNTQKTLRPKQILSTATQRPLRKVNTQLSGWNSHLISSVLEEYKNNLTSKKNGCESRLWEKNIHIHFILSDPSFILESKDTKTEKLPFKVPFSKYLFYSFKILPTSKLSLEKENTLNTFAVPF